MSPSQHQGGENELFFGSVGSELFGDEELLDVGGVRGLGVIDLVVLGGELAHGVFDELVEGQDVGGGHFADSFDEVLLVVAVVGADEGLLLLHLINKYIVELLSN